MPTDLLVNGTSIEARAATDAGKRLPGDSVRQHFRSPVVEQDNVKFVRSFLVCTAFRSRDQRLISSQVLPGSRSRQQFQEHLKVREGRYYLLNSHHRDVGLWQAGSQTNVAFVFQNQDRSRFGDAEIDATNSDVRRRELLAQDLASNAGQSVDITCGLDPKFFREQLSDLAFGLVNRRGNDMRRSLAGKLNDVLTQVSFKRGHAYGLQGRVEMDFLGHHALAFHDQARPSFTGEAANYAVRFVRIARPVNLGPNFFGVGRKLFQILIEVKQGLVFDRARLRAKLFPVVERAARAFASNVSVVG